MDETTTDADVQAQAPTEAQPEEQHAEAVTTTDSEPTQPELDDTGANDEPDVSDNSTSKTYTPEWLESKGIDLADPNAAEKLANMAFNSEKLMSRTANQKKSAELEKTVSTGAANQGTSSTDLVLGAMLFKQTHADLTNEQDDQMGKYLTENPTKIALLQNGLIDYDDVYRMSGAQSLGQPDAETLKKQGSKEALQQLASKQRATAVAGNASQNIAPKGVTKANVDAWWDGLGYEGRKDPANREKLDSILNS